MRGSIVSHPLFHSIVFICARKLIHLLLGYSAKFQFTKKNPIFQIMSVEK